MANKSKIFARGAALMLLLATLPGCLPLFGTPTVIGLALDGISYMASGKTVADHGLSMLAQKDCSVGRAIFNGTEICYDDPEQRIFAENMAVLDGTQPVLAIENFELASQSVEIENPLFSAQHPSRWPTYKDSQ